jgi:hypothetical protein
MWRIFSKTRIIPNPKNSPKKNLLRIYFFAKESPYDFVPSLWIKRPTKKGSLGIQFIWAYFESKKPQI